MTVQFPAGTPLSQAGGLPPVRGRKSDVRNQTSSSAPNPEPAAAAMQQIVLPSARDRWTGQVAKQYTPERVEQVLRSTLNGDLKAAWELFDLMEDTSPRINKNLNQRKRAVLNYLRTFTPYAEEDESATPEAELRSKLVAKALWTMRPRADENQNGFDDTIYDVLDAVGKGISLLEVDWEMRDAGKLGTIAAPKCTRWIHPRYYGYPAQADWLGLNVAEIAQARSMVSNPLTPALSPGGARESAPTTLNLQPMDGIYARIPDNKFLVCIYRGKTGHPTGAALLRRLAFWWAASNFTQSWFLNFAQIFGLPIRWANYDPNIPGLVEKVYDMLANMGSAAWGAFPTGTTLELKEPPKASGENPQVVLLDMADKQYDLAILGQSGTTEIAGPGKTGGSNAANQVLQGVEEEIVRADAKFIGKIFNDQLIPMIIRLNFSDDQMLPELCLEPEIVEDIAGLVTNYKTASDAGALTPNKDDEVHFRKKLSLPAMSKEVEADWNASKGVRAPRTATGTAGAPSPDAEVQARAKATADESIVNYALEDLTGVEAKWLGGVVPFFNELLVKSKAGDVSDAEFIQALAKAQKEIPELFGKLNHGALATALENAMSAAAVNGVARGFMNRRKAVAA